MTNKGDHLEMAIRSMKYFANDGKLDLEELSDLLALAERDGQIDDDEARILRSVINRLNQEELDEALVEKINEILKKINN